LRNLVISSMTDLFGESGVPFIDMAANQDELSRTLKGKLASVFERYGLALDSFVVQNVSLPEELQKILDSRIGMNMIGDLGRYTQYQVANSIPLAAQNEGGIAGIGAGLGAGLGIGQTMTAAMAQAMPAGPRRRSRQHRQALPAMPTRSSRRSRSCMAWWPRASFRRPSSTPRRPNCWASWCDRRLA
jgi:membrane protease subunit (stomatin/prohibitin family)